MKRVFFFAVFSLIAFSARAESVNVSFDDLPRLVVERNKSVLAGKAYVDGAQSQSGHLTRSFLPKVKVEGGAEIFQTGTSGQEAQPLGAVEAHANLFRGGKDALENKIIKSRETLAEANYQRDYALALSRARSLFADVVYYEDLLKNIEEASSASSGHAGLVQKQIQAGLTTEADRLELHMFQNELQRAKIIALEDHEHAVEELKAVLGWSRETVVAINAKTQEDNELLTLKFNAAEHPDALALRQNLEIIRLQRKQTGRWWAPSLEAYGGYSLYTEREQEFANLRDRDETVGGLKLSMTLFDGLSSRTQGQLLQHQAKGYALESEQKNRELEVIFEKLQHELKTRVELIRLMDQNVGTGRRYLKMSSAEYARGVKSGPQLLGASQKHFQEKLNLAQARRDQTKIAAELMSFLGR